MPWPQSTDYNLAIQNPGVCFRDPELKQGQPASNMLGLPVAHAGGFADVYQMECPGKSFAVKCFTREVHGLHQRYEKISEHLKTFQRSFMVEFDYQEEGILVGGAWYPILKMRWVEGLTLNAFVEEHLDRPALFDRLAQMWVKLAHELVEAGMAHGDLQHGNVMLVPRGSSLALRLIDYDGMFVPLLADNPSGERGHPNYQHPTRSEKGGGYSCEVDRFSHLVIYASLRALRVAGKKLWGRYYNSDNLLLKKEDFSSPEASTLLRELWSVGDADLHALTGHLVLASRRPPEAAPPLSAVLEGGLARPLGPAEEAEVQQVLGAPVPRRRTRLGGSQGKSALPPLPSPLSGSAADPAAPPVPAVSALPPSPSAKAEAAPVAILLPPAPPRMEAPTAPLASPGTDLPSWMLPEAIPVQPAPAPNGGSQLPAVPAASVPAVPALAVVPIPLRPDEPGTPSVLRMQAIPLKDDETAEVRRASSTRQDRPPVAEQVLDVLPADVPGDLPSPAGPPKPASGKPARSRRDPDEALLTDRAQGPSLALALVLGIVGLVVLAWGGWVLVRPSPEESPPVARSTTPVLDQVGAITLRAGESQVLNLTVVRQGWQEPLRVQLEGLPPAVRPRAESVVLEGGEQTARIELQTDFHAAQQSQLVTVSLWSGDEKLHTLEVPLTIQARPLPRLEPFEKDIVLMVGEKKDLLFAVDRKGWREDLRVQLQAPPPGVRQTPYAADGNAPEIRLELEATADADPLAGLNTLQLLMEGKVIQAETVTLRLEKPRRPTRLILPESIQLTAGAPTRLNIRIDRDERDTSEVVLRLDSSRAGPVRVPDQVRVPEGADEVAVELTPPADAAADGLVLTVRAEADGRPVDEEQLALKVSKPAVAANPMEVAPNLPEPQEVFFLTADGLQIHGTFYPGTRGRNSPAVLMLSDVGKVRKDEKWVGLARALQGKGYAVLTFDYRGHGESTRIFSSPSFLRVPENKLLVQSVSVRGFRLSADAFPAHGSFPQGYHYLLINDVTAARLYLDFLNDREELNASALILIGAGEGATLGTMLLALECARREQLPVASQRQPSRYSLQAESERVAGAVWLGVPQTLGGLPFNVTALLQASAAAKLPNIFLHGEQDFAQANLAQVCSTIANAGGLQPAGPVGFPGPAMGKSHMVRPIPNTARRGQDLLQVEQVPEIVCKAVEEVVGLRGRAPWQVEDAKRKSYVWSVTGQAAVAAKKAKAHSMLLVPLAQLGN